MPVKDLFCFFLFFLFSSSNLFGQNETLLNNFKSIIKAEIDSLHFKIVNYVAQNPVRTKNIYELVGVSKEYYDDFLVYFSSLEKNINDRNGNPDSLAVELSMLQLKKISSLPQFYSSIHQNLPEKLDSWRNEYHASKHLKENSGKIIKENSTVRTSIQKNENKFKDIEIEGLVVDQTQTKIGHDFYELFYSNWQPPDNFSNFTIVILEKALPQLGTQVTIEINENQIFQQVLQPRYDIIEETAKYGIELAYNYIQNYDAIQKQISGEDLQGSGIF